MVSLNMRYSCFKWLFSVREYFFTSHLSISTKEMKDITAHDIIVEAIYK